ncbi:hypothetical protein [Novosphingobium resinovorum]|uniref:hypothetical protein n=1 Tax=Novosphingobium resinovorum TaxID=158500 RepID=UPI002ED38E8D
MTRIAAYALALTLGATTASALPQMAIAAEGLPERDPREIAPDALIGYWKADLAASTYPGAKPTAAYRSFAYTEGGRVLVSFVSRSADGKTTFGHWAAQTDGTPSIEYHSSGGSLPWNVVSWRPDAQGRLALTVSRQGKPTIEATYQLSADGKTLTYSYAKTVVVYHRWAMEG